MTSRSRRQTRQRRTAPYYAWPEVHNDSVRWRKQLRAVGRSFTRAQSSMRQLTVALVGVGEAAAALSDIVRERELQAQIAWADRMAVLGFDMRDEHEALERGELVD